MNAEVSHPGVAVAVEEAGHALALARRCIPRCCSARHPAGAAVEHRGELRLAAVQRARRCSRRTRARRRTRRRAVLVVACRRAAHAAVRRVDRTLASHPFTGFAVAIALPRRARALARRSRSGRPRRPPRSAAVLPRRLRRLTSQPLVTMFPSQFSNPSTHVLGARFADARRVRARRPARSAVLRVERESVQVPAQQRLDAGHAAGPAACRSVWDWSSGRRTRRRSILGRGRRRCKARRPARRRRRRAPAAAARAAGRLPSAGLPAEHPLPMSAAAEEQRQRTRGAARRRPKSDNGPDTWDPSGIYLLRVRGQKFGAWAPHPLDPPAGALGSGPGRPPSGVRA